MSIIKENDFNIKNISLGKAYLSYDNARWEIPLNYDNNPVRICTNPIKLLNNIKNNKIKIITNKGLDFDNTNLKNKVLKPIDTFFVDQINKKKSTDFLKNTNGVPITKALYIEKLQGNDIKVNIVVKKKYVTNNDVINVENIDILTKIFLPVDMSVPTENRMFKPNPEQIQTLEKFESTLIGGCTVIFILEIDKLIIQKFVTGNVRHCFLTINCLQAYILDYDNVNKRIINSQIPKCIKLKFENIPNNKVNDNLENDSDDEFVKSDSDSDESD